MAFVVEASAILGGTKVSLLSVLVDTPEVVDSVVNRLVVGVLEEHGWCNGKESDVLDLELEDCYKNK